MHVTYTAKLTTCFISRISAQWFEAVGWDIAVTARKDILHVKSPAPTNPKV